MATAEQGGIEQEVLSGETPRARIVRNESRALVALVLALHQPGSAATTATKINEGQGLEGDKPRPGEIGVRQVHSQVARQLNDFGEGGLVMSTGTEFTYTSEKMKIGAVITALELLTISCSEKIGSEQIRLQDMFPRPPASRIALNMVDVLSQYNNLPIGQLAKLAGSRPDKVGKIVDDWKSHNIVARTDSDEVRVDTNFHIVADIARATRITVEDIQRHPDILERWVDVLVPGFKVNSSASTQKKILAIATELFRRPQTITALLEKRPQIQEIKPDDIILALLNSSLTSREIHAHLLANAQKNGNEAEMSDVSSLQVNYIQPLVKTGIITGRIANNGNERVWSLSEEMQQKIAQVRQQIARDYLRSGASTEVILQQLQQDALWSQYPKFAQALVEGVQRDLAVLQKLPAYVSKLHEQGISFEDIKQQLAQKFQRHPVMSKYLEYVANIVGHMQQEEVLDKQLLISDPALAWERIAEAGAKKEKKVGMVIWEYRVPLNLRRPQEGDYVARNYHLLLFQGSLENIHQLTQEMLPSGFDVRLIQEGAQKLAQHLQSAEKTPVAYHYTEPNASLNQAIIIFDTSRCFIKNGTFHFSDIKDTELRGSLRSTIQQMAHNLVPGQKIHASTYSPSLPWKR